MKLWFWIARESEPKKMKFRYSLIDLKISSISKKIKGNTLKQLPSENIDICRCYNIKCKLGLYHVIGIMCGLKFNKHY